MNAIRVERADRTPRVEQAEQYANNWQDYEDRARAGGTTVGAIMLRDCPVHEDNEERHPVASTLRYLGVALRDDPVNNIQSTPLTTVYGGQGKDYLVPLLQNATQDFIKGKFEGTRDRARRMETLAAGLGQFAAGSAMRAYFDTELRQSNPLSANPELAVIAANVIRQDEDVIRTIEKVNASLIDDPPIVAELADIQTVGIQQSETPSVMQRRGAGVKIAEKLRSNNRYSSEHLFQDAERFQIGIERRMVQACINDLLIGADGSTLTGTALELSAAGLMDMIQAMHNSYEITTIVGLKDTIKRYMLVDRTAFYNNSGQRSDLGSSIGSDNYKTGANREVRDVAATQTNLTTNAALAIDAREMIDVYVRNGSDMVSEEFINRSRSWEILWDIEFGAAKRHPKSDNGRLHLAVAVA